MKFCSKCGKELMDEAVICIGCGCAVEITQSIVSEPSSMPTNAPTLQKPTYKSLSMIFQAILAAAAIVLLFFDGYMIYKLSRSGTLHYGIGFKDDLDVTISYYDKSFHTFTNADVFPTFLIILLISVPLLLSVLNYFLASKQTINCQKRMYWTTFGCSAISLVYTIVFSLIYAHSVYPYTSQYTSYYTTKDFVKYEYLYEFENFSVLFYIEIAILVLMAVVALLDAIGKPILKQKIKGNEKI